MHRPVALLIPLVLLAASLTARSVSGYDSEVPELTLDRTSSVPEVSLEELSSYQFKQPEDIPETRVNDLSMGQKYVLSRQRRQVADLFSRHLGFKKIQQNQADLKALQTLVDIKAVSEDDTLGWQAMGVVLGDLMAHEFDMHWVVVEDEFGESKALQWKNTMNFVFPVTLLSKRVQFEQNIDVQVIFDDISTQVDVFKDYEKTHRKLRLPGAERLEVN